MVGSAGPPREHPCYDSVRRRPSAGEQVDEVLGAAPRWHGCPYERGHQCGLSSLVRSCLGTRLQPPEPRGTAVCHLRCPSTVFHCSPELTKTATPCFRVRAAQEGRPPVFPVPMEWKITNPVLGQVGILDNSGMDAKLSQDAARPRHCFSPCSA